jgi:hypothetical protein
MHVDSGWRHNEQPSEAAGVTRRETLESRAHYMHDAGPPRTSAAPARSKQFIRNRSESENELQKKFGRLELD